MNRLRPHSPRSWSRHHGMARGQTSTHVTSPHPSQRPHCWRKPPVCMTRGLWSPLSGQPWKTSGWNVIGEMPGDLTEGPLAHQDQRGMEKPRQRKVSAPRTVPGTVGQGRLRPPAAVRSCWRRTGGWVPRQLRWRRISLLFTSLCFLEICEFQNFFRLRNRNTVSVS